MNPTHGNRDTRSADAPGPYALPCPAFCRNLLLVALGADVVTAWVLFSIFDGVRSLEGIGWMLLNIPVMPLAPLWDGQIFNQLIPTQILRGMTLAWAAVFFGSLIRLGFAPHPSRSRLLLARLLVVAWMLSGGLTLFLQAATHC